MEMTFSTNIKTVKKSVVYIFFKKKNANRFFHVIEQNQPNA
jgi:hypothetical protein